MTVYSYSQLEQLWLQAAAGTQYDTQSWAALMAAIAEAESSGNSNATGGVGEKGLWQINPAAWGSLATYDPQGNAKAAVYVLEHQGLGAWSTYNQGLYKKYLQGSVPPASGSLPGGGSAGGSSGSGGTVLTGGGINYWSVFANAGLGQLLWSSPTSGIANDPLQGLIGLSDDVAQFFKWISWMFNPAHWLRIGAFFVGIVAFAGAGFMIKEAL